MFVKLRENQEQVEEYWGHFNGWLFIPGEHRGEVEDETAKTLTAAVTGTAGQAIDAVL